MLYIPSIETRELRDLTRRRHYLFCLHKNDVQEQDPCLSSPEDGSTNNKADLSTQEGGGRKTPQITHDISRVDDYLDSIEFPRYKNWRARQRNQGTSSTRQIYAKGACYNTGNISYYGALLISSEIAGHQQGSPTRNIFARMPNWLLELINQETLNIRKQITKEIACSTG